MTIFGSMWYGHLELTGQKHLQSFTTEKMEEGKVLRDQKISPSV